MKAFGAKRDLQLLLVVVLLAGVILWVYSFIALKPLLQGVSELRKDAHSAWLQLQHSEQAVAQGPQLREEYSQLSEAIGTLRTSLPSEEELPSVIGLLSDWASQTGVKIQTIFPQRSFESRGGTLGGEQPAAKGPELYKEIPIQIDALAGFHQLGGFLSRVESGEQTIQLRSLRISGNPKEPRRHNAKLVLIVYFSASDAESAPSGSSPPAARGGGSGS